MSTAASASASIDAVKAAIRRETKLRLAALSAELKQKESAEVTQKFLNSEVYRNSHYVSVYMSMDCEVDTRPIVEDIFKTGRVCYVPYYTKSTMKMLRMTSLEECYSLPLTKWNIHQPTDDQNREEALETGKLDLIVVPGVAFGVDGQRLGRGRAYYDKYLTSCMTHSNLGNLKKAGLSFQAQLCNNIPMSTTDIWLDYVFHPPL